MSLWNIVTCLRRESMPTYQNQNPKHWLYCTWPQFFPINREISMFFIARTNQTEHFGLSLLIFKIFKRSYKLCYVSILPKLGWIEHHSVDPYGYQWMKIINIRTSPDTFPVFVIALLRTFFQTLGIHFFTLLICDSIKPGDILWLLYT